jgi:LCP family protein required for cell wall assembly
LTLVVGGGFYLVATTWGDVRRVAINSPTAAAEDDASSEEPTATTLDESEQITVPPSGDGLDISVIVGSDSRQDLEDTEGFGDFDGERADVIMVLIRDRSADGKLGILSLPRDLWVDKVCEEGQHRINDTLEGCGTMNGPSVVVDTVEDLIGLPVDHFALIDLAGFQKAVDAVGRYEICVEYEVRDERSNLSLPEGCTHTDGVQTLAWLRSRHTQELTEDGWRTVEGVSDLTRNERQREFLVFMMSQLGDFSSPQDIIGVAQAVAPFVTVDQDLTLMDAVGLASTLRGLGKSGVVELEVPVSDYIAPSGASVLQAVIDPASIVADFLNGPTVQEGRGETG